MRGALSPACERRPDLIGARDDQVRQHLAHRRLSAPRLAAQRLLLRVPQFHGRTLVLELRETFDFAGRIPGRPAVAEATPASVCRCSDLTERIRGSVRNRDRRFRSMRDRRSRRAPAVLRQPHRGVVGRRRVVGASTTPSTLRAQHTTTPSNDMANWATTSATPKVTAAANSRKTKLVSIVFLTGLPLALHRRCRCQSGADRRDRTSVFGLRAADLPLN